jgi:hypothetical protein
LFSTEGDPLMSGLVKHPFREHEPPLPTALLLVDELLVSVDQLRAYRKTSDDRPIWDKLPVIVFAGRNAVFPTGYATAKCARVDLDWENRASRYLKSLVDEDWIDESTVSLITQAVAQVLRLEPRMGNPDIGPSEDRHAVITWDLAAKHFEVEVLPGGDVEMFFRDRNTGQLWSLDSRLPIPREAEQQAKQFLQKFVSS